MQNSSRQNLKTQSQSSLTLPFKISECFQSGICNIKKYKTSQRAYDVTYQEAIKGCPALKPKQILRWNIELIKYQAKSQGKC